MPPLITLLTDFGTGDGYVAAMKGVILSRNPSAVIIDISHHTPPQDIRSAAYVLHTAAPHFPADTIHAVVVDPGVGTERRILLLETPDGRYLSPDNGVLTYVLEAYGSSFSGLIPCAKPHGPPPTKSIPLPTKLSARAVTNTKLFLPGVSQTFHGRDIVAPVAAALSAGLSPNEVGPAIDAVAVFSLPRLVKDAAGNLRGFVMHVDRFGNLVTNIRAGELPSDQVMIDISGHKIDGLSSSYERGESLLAIFGSSGYLEIAVRNGNAAQTLGVGRGTQFLVRLP